MAVASIVARELLGALFADTKSSYVITILIVYGVGTFVAFRLQEAFTFARVPASERRASVLAFYVVVVIVGFLTAGIAYVLRYFLGFESLFRPYGGAASFACSTLITSVVSYVLSSRFVFTR